MQKCNARKDPQFEMLQQNKGKESYEEGIIQKLSGQFGRGRLNFQFNGFSHARAECELL
jgi:hypothetical protein